MSGSIAGFAGRGDTSLRRVLGLGLRLRRATLRLVVVAARRLGCVGKEQLYETSRSSSRAGSSSSLILRRRERDLTIPHTLLISADEVLE